MRHFVRISLALLGLAMATPTAVWAGPPARKPKASGSSGHQHRKGLFGREILCPDCQRAKLRAEGIEIPPPPPVPSGIVVEGPECAACEAGTTVVSGPMMVVNGGEAPGRAVVGESAPGTAVVGGMIATAEPSPIGVVQPRPGASSRLAGRSAPADRAVQPSSVMAPDPIHPQRNNSPHILAHLFGFSSIGRDYREAMERKSREKHASIPYGPQAQKKVADLPASVVYGGR